MPAELRVLHDEAAGCRRCPQLVAARSQVVVGAGPAEADLLFVAEAPGRVEDELGVPLAGKAGELLTTLLGEIGLTRDDAYLTYAVKCHPPAGRDPLPAETANCQEWLHRQLEVVRPRLVCTLGTFPTRALRGDPAPIRAVHGVPEVCVVGDRAVRVLPLFAPAAALYAKPLLAQLRADVAQIPDLLALDPPDTPVVTRPSPQDPPPDPPMDGQMGLF